MPIDNRDLAFLKKLKRHPTLCARIENLINVIENVGGEVTKADAAERQVIEEIRHMGHEALTAWANYGIEQTTVAAQANSEWRPAGKKNFIGTPLSEK